MFVAMLVVIGAGAIVLLGVNLVLLVTQRSARAGASGLSKWAWGVSVVSLVFPYVAVFSLVMAVVDLARHAPAARPAHSWLAVVNSVWALATLTAILTLVFGHR
jgi:hypothetical protein